MSAEMIGREPELAMIAGFLRRAARGPAALLLSGEAGIGKTALWDACVETARADGAVVLACRPVEAEA
jgi:predicted ATPase